MLLNAFLLLLISLEFGKFFASGSATEGPACTNEISLSSGSGEVTNLLQLSFDSDLLLTTSRLDDSVRIWSVEARAIKRSLSFENPRLFGPLAVVELPNGQIAIGSSDKRLRVYSFKEDKLKFVTDLSFAPIALVFSEKTSSLYIQQEDGAVLTFKLSDFNKPTIWPEKIEAIGPFSLLQDATTAVIAGSSGSAYLLNLKAERIISTLKGAGNFDLSKFIQLSNGLLVGGDLEGNAFLWNTKQSMMIVKKFKAHNRAILDLAAYGPDGFISIALDGALKAWEISQDLKIGQKTRSLIKGRPIKISLLSRSKGLIAVASKYESEFQIEIGNLEGGSRIMITPGNLLEPSEYLMAFQAGASASNVFFTLRGRRKIEVWNSTVWKTADSLKTKEEVMNIKGISQNLVLFTLANGDVALWRVFPSNAVSQIDNMKNASSKIDYYLCDGSVLIAFQTAGDILKVVASGKPEQKSAVFIKEESLILDFRFVDNKTLALRTNKGGLNIWKSEKPGETYKFSHHVPIDGNIMEIQRVDESFVAVLHDSKTIRVYPLSRPPGKTLEFSAGFQISSLFQLNQRELILFSKESGSLRVLAFEGESNFTVKKTINGFGDVLSVAKLSNGIIVTTTDGSLKFYDWNVNDCLCSEDLKLMCGCENEKEYKVSLYEGGLVCQPESAADIQQAKSRRGSSALALEVLLIFLFSMLVFTLIYVLYKRKKRREASLIKKSDFL